MHARGHEVVFWLLFVCYFKHMEVFFCVVIVKAEQQRSKVREVLMPLCFLVVVFGLFEVISLKLHR